MVSSSMHGLIGGVQGIKGTFAGREYSIGSFFWDKVIEGFAGSHDYIGGQLPRFYDKEGNTGRDRSGVKKTAAEVWTVTAIPLALPFALPDIVGSDTVEFILQTK